MVGLGTLFIAVMARRGAAALAAAARTHRARMLWVLMLAFPFPYIATTAGWMTAELGRQPWLVYGLHAHRRRHLAAASAAGNVAFTTLGFLGLYLVLGMLFLYLSSRDRARAGIASRGSAVAPGRRGRPH